MIISDIEEPIVVGSSRVLRFTVTNSSGPVDISSAFIIFSVKKYIGDAVYIFQLKNAVAGGDASEIDLVTDGTDGKFDVFLTPTETILVIGGDYVYDAQYTIGSDVEKKPWEIFPTKAAVT